MGNIRGCSFYDSAVWDLSKKIGLPTGGIGGLNKGRRYIVARYFLDERCALHV